jgi:hypothetical protein
MDLSKLSTEDLLALKAGDLSKVSTEGLMALKGEAASAPKGDGGIGSGVLRGFSRAAGTVGDFVSSILPDNPTYQAQKQQFADKMKALDASGKGNLSYGIGDVAGQVLATAPVGAALGATASSIPMLSKVPGLVDALSTSGFNAGRLTGWPALAMRTAGGAITGGATAGLINPEDAGKGALIGGALPGALKLAGTIGHAAGSGVQNVLGLAAGVGKEPIKQAFQAGIERNPAFLENMRGNVPITDVLDTAKQGLSAMRSVKSEAYRSGMIPIKNDKAVLSLDGISSAIDDAMGMVSFKGQVKNESAANAIQKMRAVVDDWKGLDPAVFHTPEGLDALKQKLGGILESIPYQEKTALTAANKVYTAAKASITDQAPEYAKVMKDYSVASDQIKEIERALSLGDRASKDTAMRKLQSLMRNNVQTNYGERLNLANALENQGNVDLMPALAGQALNSWTPRSLSGQIGGGATVIGSMMTGNPLPLAALPFQSPRMIGNVAYGLGTLGSAPASLLGGGTSDLLGQFGYRAAPLLGVGR